MPDDPCTVSRGVHRHRAVFVSTEDGLTPCMEPEDHPAAAEAHIRRVARDGRAISLVIADCRLLEPGNPVAALLPKNLSARIQASGQQTQENPASIRRATRLRKLSPWIGAIVTAATGYLIFYLRAA